MSRTHRLSNQQLAAILEYKVENDTTFFLDRELLREIVKRLDPSATPDEQPPTRALQS